MVAGISYFVRSLALLVITAASLFRSISVPTSINRDDRIYIFRSFQYTHQSTALPVILNEVKDLPIKNRWWLEFHIL
jgi:hypothetical protein